MISVNEKLTAIADKIRSYSGTLAPLTLDEMPAAIDKAAYEEFHNGFNQGTSTGIEIGYAEGLEAGQEQGKQAQYDEFWDAYQDEGNRTDYAYAFARWRIGVFKPKYKIKPIGAITMMFAYSQLTDIAQLLEDARVTLDTSEATGFREFTSYGSITRIPEISTIGASSLNSIFYNAPYLHTIDNLIFKDDGSQTWDSPSFKGLASLVNIEIEGKIGANLNMSNSSKLSYDSLINIINNLKDYSETSETRTLTLHATAKARLEGTNEGLAAIEEANRKGWSL